MSARRNQPTATLLPARYGAWTVIRPDGKAELADSLADARRAAIRAGAILTRVMGDPRPERTTK